MTDDPLAWIDDLDGDDVVGVGGACDRCGQFTEWEGPLLDFPDEVLCDRCAGRASRR